MEKWECPWFSMVKVSLTVSVLHLTFEYHTPQLRDLRHVLVLRRADLGKYLYEEALFSARLCIIFCVSCEMFASED